MQINKSKTNDEKTIGWGSTDKLIIEQVPDIHNEGQMIFLVRSLSSSSGMDAAILTNEIIIDGMKLITNPNAHPNVKAAMEMYGK